MLRPDFSSATAPGCVSTEARATHDVVAYNYAMENTGAADSYIPEASLAMRKVLDALKHPGLIEVKPTIIIYVLGILTGAFCFIFLAFLAIRNTWVGFRWDWITWLLLLLPVAGIAVVVFAMRQTLRRIHRFRLGIRQRIEDAGLLERIAQGPEGLPDIYVHTPFPWRLMLGARPKTLARSLQVVAYNIDWYLLPEPKVYIKPEWITLLVEFCLIPAILILPYVLIYSNSSVGHDLNTTMIVMGFNVCLPILSVAMAWDSTIQSACMILTRKALSGIIRERYGLQ